MKTKIQARVTGPVRCLPLARTVQAGHVRAESRRLVFVEQPRDQHRPPRRTMLSLPTHVEAAELAAGLLGHIPALEAGTDMVRALRTICEWVAAQRKKKRP